MREIGAAAKPRLNGAVTSEALRHDIDGDQVDGHLGDAVIDMAAAIDDPATGAMRLDTHPGDSVHATRSGHIDMANAVDPALLLPETKGPPR